MKRVMATMLLACAFATPGFAGDLKDELMALEKGGWDAWAKGNGEYFRNRLTEDHVQVVAGAGLVQGRDKIIADVTSHGCEVAGFEFMDANVRQLAPDVAIVSYTAKQQATCDGQRLPAKVYSTAVYVRQGGKWLSANYQETPAE
jgi:uncharacterized protein (TIGR02246 family)